jgi:DNA replication protein DnaC
MSARCSADGPERTEAEAGSFDEVGYIPFDPDAANLFFQLVAPATNRARSSSPSNLPFGRWSEIFGDGIVAAAMIDRLVHHAAVLTFSGDSCGPEDRL